MASVPIPGPGSIVIAGNMREARRQGMSRNMEMTLRISAISEKG